MTVSTWRRNKPMKNATKTGCIGAVLVHPILFLLGFAKGVLFGHPEPQVMSATSGYGSFENGLAGGVNAVEDIAIHYIMTLGIAVIIVSLAGAGLAFLMSWIFSRGRNLSFLPVCLLTLFGLVLVLLSTLAIFGLPNFVRDWMLGN